MIHIDTGDRADATLGIPDWFIDQMPEDMPQDRLIHQYAYHLIGKLAEYRAMKFARKHLLLHWGFLRALADTHPEIFDEAMAAYAEVFAASEVPRLTASGIHAPNSGNTTKDTHDERVF